MNGDGENGDGENGDGEWERDRNRERDEGQNDLIRKLLPAGRQAASSSNCISILSISPFISFPFLLSFHFYLSVLLSPFSLILLTREATLFVRI